MSGPQALRQDLLARMFDLMQDSEPESELVPEVSLTELQVRRFERLADANEFLAAEIERGTVQSGEQKRLSLAHFEEFGRALTS